MSTYPRHPSCNNGDWNPAVRRRNGSPGQWNESHPQRQRRNVREPISSTWDEASTPLHHKPTSLESKAMQEDINRINEIIEEVERQQFEVDHYIGALDIGKRQLDGGTDFFSVQLIINEVICYLETGSVAPQANSADSGVEDQACGEWAAAWDRGPQGDQGFPNRQGEAEAAWRKTASSPSWRSRKEPAGKGVKNDTTTSEVDSRGVNELFGKGPRKVVAKQKDAHKPKRKEASQDDKEMGKAKKKRKERRKEEGKKCRDCGLERLPDHECRRRKCANCGEFGHALKCSRTERCSFCAKLGHVELDCPSLASRDKSWPRCINCLSALHAVGTCAHSTRCAACGQDGHVFKFCEEASRMGFHINRVAPDNSESVFGSAPDRPPSSTTAAPPAVSTARPGRPLRACCFNCGADHLLSRCPVPLVCWNCRRRGHSENLCSVQGRGSLKCINCYTHHHFINSCPLPLQCLCCGQAGHTAKACTVKEQASNVIVMCPYDAAHRMAASELRGHLASCGGHPLLMRPIQGVGEGGAQSSSNSDSDSGDSTQGTDSSTHSTGSSSSSSDDISSSSSTAVEDGDRGKRKRKKKPAKKNMKQRGKRKSSRSGSCDRSRSRSRSRSRGRRRRPEAQRPSSPPASTKDEQKVTPVPKEGDQATPQVNPATPAVMAKPFAFAVPAPLKPSSKPKQKPNPTTTPGLQFCVLISGFPPAATDEEIFQYLVGLQGGSQWTRVVRGSEGCQVGLLCKDKEAATSAAFRAAHKMFRGTMRKPLQATVMLHGGLMRSLKLAECGDPEKC